MHELTLAVVGIDFPNEDKAKSSRRMELLLCSIGEPVELRPEPKNKHDPHAVAVFSARGVQVGYVTAERAPLVGRRIREGMEVQAEMQGVEGAAGYIRVRFGGGAPTMPRSALIPRPAVHRPVRMPVERRVIDVDAFYPDPEGPFWGA